MNWGWINTFGLIIVVLMLVPNVIYAYNKKPVENKCTNKAWNILEQIGRYGTMILMVFNVGIAEFGFWSKVDFIIWLIFIPILILVYFAVWFIYFKKPQKLPAMLLAIIPSSIFILNGILLRHWILLIFGAVFAISHIFITYKNTSAL